MHASMLSLVLGAWFLITPTTQQVEKTDAKTAIEAAKTKAASENRRVLVVWGTEGSEPCRKLDDLFAKDEDVRRKLLYEYDVVRVASSNLELARALGADVEKTGVPFLTVLDAKGAVLANQAAAGMASDPKQLLELLTRHQAAYLKADEVRQRAIQGAKAAGKKLLLTFGAPW